VIVAIMILLLKKIKVCFVCVMCVKLQNVKAECAVSKDCFPAVLLPLLALVFRANSGFATSKKERKYARTITPVQF